MGSGADAVLQSIPVVGTYADAALNAVSGGGGKKGKQKQAQAQDQSQPGQQQGQSGSSIGTFNPQSIANANLLNGQFSDFAQFGLPTSDQQMLAELGNTTLYVGDSVTTSHAMAGDSGEQSLTGKTPKYSSAADLIQQLEHMDRQSVIQLQNQMIAGQWLPQSYHANGIVDAPTEAAYLKLLTTAARYQNAGVNITPDSLLSQSASGGAGTNVQSTSTTVDLTDPMTARGVVNGIFQQILGRAPNSEDIAGFTNALQGYEEQHPGTSTTESTVNAQGQVTKQKSTEKTGGMGSSLSLRGGDVAAAEEYIDQQHGGEEAQVGIDTLTHAFSQLLGI